MKRLHRIRKYHRLTLAMLSVLTDEPTVLLSEIERGKREPDAGTLKRLADFFFVAPDTLMEEIGEAQPAKPYRSTR